MSIARGRGMEIRIEGVLTSWNKERGFGFIEPLSGGGQDIFVHASDFPRQGGAPRPGERLTFEIGLNAEGKKKATAKHVPEVKPDNPKVKLRSIFGQLDFVEDGEGYLLKLTADEYAEIRGLIGF